ncbi:hypothetical protein [Isachenkonia alkalipeptolytica]|uniref:Twin-arginine translocation signal domain-containing protein n=1 Tax=Isachenkonia alkalipeptolytica TaxID=2565777 RepID=A0AA44BDP9_9CLOT|nr:hypothetical protein [Isachenkonia alkalipeptolytica]NBG87330.1 hypothetical protein [Isachenkonia alkalipeptolytica]
MSEKQITRKNFLKGMGTTLAGVTVLGGMSSILTGCDEDVQAAGDRDEAVYPVNYKKVDPDMVADRAYNAYHEQGG